MKAINKTIVLSLLISLAGCATVEKVMPQSGKNNDEVAAQSVTPIKVPEGMSAGNMQSYYPVPPIAVTESGGMATQPAALLVPPNSQVQQPAPVVSHATPAPQNPTVLASSSSALVLAMNKNQAWGKVGKALSSSGYKIMQQDKGMGAYYILDQGKLTKDTPIYRVNLKSSGDNTTVTVVDNNGQLAPAAGRILGTLKGKL